MKLTLREIHPETADVTSFYFEPEQPLTWRAGQYLEYHLPHANEDDRGEVRWFTIAAAPFEGRVQITTRFAAEHGSSFKAALHQLRVGDQIEVGDVDGDFVVDNPAAPHVFIAGGIGITPFRAILNDLDHAGQPLNVQLLYGNRGPDNIVFKAELEALVARHPEFKITNVLEPQRIDADVVRANVPDLAAPLFYVSGPEPMVKALAAMLEEIGVPKDHIKIDDFPGYPATL